MSKILQKKIAIHQEPSKEMEILAPYSDWAEQDPDTWWKYTCKATIKIITESGIKASLITSS